MSVRNLEELGINLQKIVRRLLANQNLCKLLENEDKDPLSHPDIEDTKKLLHDRIRMIPIVIQKDARSQISIRILKGDTNTNNSEFRDIYIGIEVFVPTTQWIIKNESLRPFLIMGEVQKSLNSKKINGLGKITGGDFSLSYVTEEVVCYDMVFRITEYD